MKRFLNKSFFGSLAVGVTVCFLLWANILAWQSSLVGWILLLIYVAVLAEKWRWIFAKIFGLEKKLVELKIISWLMVVALVGLLSGAVIVLSILSNDAIALVLLLVWIITLLLQSYLRPVVHVVILDESEKEKLVLFDRPFWILPLGFFVLLFTFISLFFLVQRGADIAWTPWQFIDSQYLWWFFSSCFLIGLSVFARFRTRSVLWMIILLSVLLHLYLPISHELIWGGDIWRLMAVENRIVDGQAIAPHMFFVPQKYAYGALWGLSVIGSKVLDVSLLDMSRWLIPVLFSITIPVLLFRIGFLLFQSRRRGLLLAWLSLLPFPAQVWGSMTLPVSFGYIFFFLAFWLWLEYWRQRGRRQRFLVISFSILLLFGYPLHFILIWSIVILRAIWGRLSKIVNTALQLILQAVLIFISLFIIPAVELVSRYSYLSWQLDWWKNIKQFVGQFSGWFYASMIRPHDIVNGNLFFNHTPERAFADNFFLHWRWWLIFAMFAFWAISIFGLWISRRRDKNLWPAVWIASAITFGGYIISWYFLDGDHLFARRLDMLLPILTLMMFISGLEGIFIKWRQRENHLRWAVLAVVLFLSFFITAVYASGPDVRVIDVQNEYNVAEYIWRLRGEVGGSKCVLADTWVLLPLETLSSGAMIGGGFPMDYNFGQTERVALFKKFSTNPEPQDLLAMKKLTGANQCWFVQSLASLSQATIDKITTLTGVKPRQVNGTLVWIINLKS